MNMKPGDQLDIPLFKDGACLLISPRPKVRFERGTFIRQPCHTDGCAKRYTIGIVFGIKLWLHK